MKKFELTNETQQFMGHVLYQIKALKNFADVHAGDIGGWVECEKNLSQIGNAWIYGNARISDNAWVYTNQHYVVTGPIGSRDDYATFFRTENREIMVVCGCFIGSIDIFLKKVFETHGHNKHAEAYRAAANLARIQIDLDEEDNND